MKTSFILATRMSVLFILCVFFSLPDRAQDIQGKPNVFIDYFKRSPNISFAWVEGLRNNVITGIQKLGRVELIDVDSKDVLRIEQSRRESESISTGESNDMDRVAVMLQEGANYLIQGTVSTMTTTRNKRDDGGVYYTATISFTLKVVDPNTGKLVGTQTFNYGGNLLNFSTGDTPDEAISKTSGSAVNGVRDFIDTYFSVEGTILEACEVRRDKVKKVYIDLGSDLGVSEDTYFAVYLIRKIAGRDSRKEIGRLKVEAVEGGDLSLCEVKKGDKEIKAAIDAGQNLAIKLIPKPSSLF